MNDKVATVEPADGMATLRRLFPKGEADEYNIVLFSVLGKYTAIEAVEGVLNGEPIDGEIWETNLTFMVIRPRTGSLICGECIPETLEDIMFLKSIRLNSKKVIVHDIGEPI